MSSPCRTLDFGIAKALAPGERAYTICGTQDYFSPELVGKKGVTRAGDIWTFGVFMFEISAGYPPFTGGTRAAQYVSIAEADLRTVPVGPRT